MLIMPQIHVILPLRSAQVTASPGQEWGGHGLHCDIAVLKHLLAEQAPDSREALLWGKQPRFDLPSPAWHGALGPTCPIPARTGGRCGAPPAFVPPAPPRRCPLPAGRARARELRERSGGRSRPAVPSPAALSALRGRAGLREEPREEPGSAALCRQPPQDGRKGRRAPAPLAARPPRAASPPSSAGGEAAQEGRRGRGRAGFRNGLFQPLLRCCSSPVLGKLLVGGEA